MDNKKRGLILLVFSIILVTIGATYAYYEAVVHGTGNTNAESSALTATLGEVEFNGVSTFDTSTLTDIYPGFIGIQSFTVSPYRDGYGVYEIDVEATVPAEFGSDIKLTLYKTSDNTNNYLTRQEGTLTQSSIGFSKHDILTTVGDLEKVYESNLSTTSLGILEQVEFNIVENEFENPDTTPDGYYTYYAVYEYLDNGVQDAQEGLDFSSKITVRYVAEKTFIPVNGAQFFANLASSGEQSDLFYDESSGSYYFSPDSQNNYVYFNNQMPEIVNGYVINYTDMVRGNFESEESCLADGRDGPRLGDFTYRCVQSSEGGYDLLVSGYSTDSFVETSEECEIELGEWPSEYSSCINKSIPVGWKVIAITNNEVNLNASTSLKLVPLDIEAQKMLSDAYNTNFGIGDYIALDSEVLITGGDGSFENPYRLSIETPIDVLYSWGRINADNPGVLDYHQLGDNYHGIFIRTIKNNRNVCIIKNDEPVCLDRSANEDVLYDIFGVENCNHITEPGPTNASIFADIRPSLLPNVDNDGYSLSKVNSLGNGDINCQNESYRCERNGCITTEGYYCRFNGTCNYNSDGVIGNGFL